MSKAERELDTLFAELVATEPERGDDRAERERRRRMIRAIDGRAAEFSQHGRSSPKRVRVWIASSAAAAALLAVFAGANSRSPAPSLEPEKPFASVATSGRQPNDPESARATSVHPPEIVPVRPRPAAKDTKSPQAPSVPLADGSLAAPARGGSTAPVPDASLAAQNELFQAAVRAARRGDDAGALERFELLLERYPGSPLAMDARVRKFRTLARLGKTVEAREAAAQYLARHPEGFAASEAKSLVEAAPPPSEPAEP